jgi:PAS domain S-box-containing protein
MKTLIVEDDLMTQCVLAKVLAERGHEVVSYENAEQAILAYQKEFYPLLFLDAGLPGMGGLQFCKWVRSQPNGDKIFIMVATAPGQPADMGEILAVGANDFLPKPFDVTALGVRLTIAERQMKDFFERKGLEESLRQSQESFHRVVKTANDGAWLLNAQFRTEYVNPQMAEMLGCQVQELADSPVIDFVPDDARRETEKLLAHQEAGKDVRREFQFRRKDGSECAAFLSATSIRTETGEFAGAVWMVADLTRSKAVEAEAQQARKEIEVQVRDLKERIKKANTALEAEAAERKKIEHASHKVRTELETRLRELEVGRAGTLERLKTETDNRKKAEEQFARTRTEFETRVEEIGGEMAKAREALQAETSRHKEAENAFKQAQKELEAKLQKQADDLARANKDFQIESGSRKQVEEALHKAHGDLESNARHHADELARSRKAQDTEIAERQRMAEALRKLQQELESNDRRHAAELAKAERAQQAEAGERARVVESLQKVEQELAARNKQHSEVLAKAEDSLRGALEEKKKAAEGFEKARHDLDHRAKELTTQLTEARDELKGESTERKRAEQELLKFREELAARNKQHSEVLAKAEDSLRGALEEKKKAAEGFEKTRHDLDHRAKELTGQLAQAREELKGEGTERKRAEQESLKFREELAAKLKEHTTELLKINQDIKAEMVDRKKLSDELLKAREELSQRVKDHTAQAVKAGDEFRATLAERTRSEDALMKARQDVELKLNEHVHELSKAREQLKLESAERARLEQALQTKENELEARLRERSAELAKLHEELKQRMADLARTNEELNVERASRKQAEEIARQTRAELDSKAAEDARVNEELKARVASLGTATEELTSEITASKQAELRGAACSKLAKELNAARTPHDAARIISNVAQDLLGWDACSVELYSSEENRIQPVLNIDAVNGRPADVPPHYAGPQPSPIMRRVMADGPQLILRSGPSSSHTDLILFGDRARLSMSLMYVAINAGQRVVGFLSVQSYTPDAYDQTDLQTLEVLADHCGGTLERIHAEEIQGRSEERLQLIARATNDVVWDWNVEGDKLWWNDAFTTVFGYKAAEVEHRIDSWKDRLHPDDREKATASLQHCIDGGEPSWTEEYRFRRNDGSYAHVVDRGYVIRDENGKAIRMIGAMVDVSHRKQVEEAMIEGQARKGAILETALDGIVTIDHEGKIFDWNPAAEKMFGQRRADVLGKELAQFIVPESLRDKQLEGLTGHFASGGGPIIGKRIELTGVRVDGREFPVEVAISRIPTDGPPIFTGFIRDITERKRAEVEIQKLAAFPRWNPNPIFEFSTECDLTYFNAAAAEMALALGKEHPSGILPENLAEIVKDCLSKGHNRLGLETTVGGRTVSWSFFPIMSSRTLHCYAVDITERTSLEAQLRQAQKMESVGQLAAGVAHDFNNLLSIVQGYSTLLLDDKDLKNETVEALKQINSATQRATHLTRQLLTFSRKQTLHIQTLDLNEVINSVNRLLRRVIGESVALQFNYSPHLPAVEADTGMMEQVIMNLAINARDAMPEGGQLMIGTKPVEIPEGYSEHNPEARPGRFVCLSVSDTGCGMDEATLERIFEPFFTTKPAGKGTGLGLATVYGIVKQHRGWIEVQSQVSNGTTFRIYLPASPKAVAPAPDYEAAPAAHGGGSETVLLVEDEPAVLGMAKGILERQGYKVLSAASGDEALPVWQQNAPGIRLLLTDMVMPGSLNGRELAEKLLSEKPDLKVIYTSGYSVELLGTGLTTSKNFVFLQKPYRPDALAQIVRDCLDEALA